ncbi:MAG: acyltransferase family protein [Chloroflexi bacterium]|nr:acyltransferase family protein [Chloroflexota bacterium]
MATHLATICFPQLHSPLSLLRFYERRARRILPALFVILIVVSMTAWMLIPKEVAQDAYQSVLAALGMSSNIVFWQLSSYWDPASELRPLLHTWSLGVEEQFYLIYPLLFLILWKWERRGNRWFMPVIVAGIAASFGLMLWVRLDDPSAAFYLLPTRSWELFAGAATAWLLPNHRRDWASAAWYARWRQLGATAGLALIALMIAPLPFGNTTRLLASVIGAVLVLVFAVPLTWGGRLLGSRLFVAVGLISYSAYLIHQPVFVAVRLWQPDSPSLMTMLGAFIIVLLLAWVSWRFIEQPFRRVDMVGRRAFFASMGICVVVIAGVGIAGRNTNLATFLYRATLTEKQRAVYDETFTAKTVERSSKCWFFYFEMLPKSMAKYEECVKQYGRAIVLLGDSHTGDFYGGLTQTSHHPFVVRAALEPCGATRMKCVYRDPFEFIRSRKDTIQIVVYLNAANRVMHFDGGEPVPDLGEVDQSFQRLISISGLLQGPEVYVIGPYVEPGLVIQPMLSYAMACDLGRVAVSPDIVRGFEKLDVAFVQHSMIFPAVRYVSTLRHYVKEKDTYLFNCDASFWRDGNHLTEAGRRRLATWLSQSIPVLAGGNGKN